MIGPAGKPRVAGSISGGDMHFYFEFFACFHCLQITIGAPLVNEIKHDHLPAVIVVLDTRYD